MHRTFLGRAGEKGGMRWKGVSWCIIESRETRCKVTTKYSIIIISCRSPSWQADFGPVCVSATLWVDGRKRSLWNCFLMSESSLGYEKHVDGETSWRKSVCSDWKLLYKRALHLSLAWHSSVIHDKLSSFFQDHLNNVYTLRLSSILRDPYNAPTR